jgi:hypothetical protein
MSDESHLRLSEDALTSLAASEREHGRRQRRALLILLVCLVVGLGVIVFALEEVAKTQPPKVVIDPAKLPPIRPGPAR